MKQGLGGLLSLALGVVLIAGGSLDGGSSGTAGTVPPSCASAPGVAVPCPVGTIAITESAAPASVQPPGAPTSWTVTITSANCSTTSGNPLNEALTVPTGGTATSSPLFVFGDLTHASTCNYTLDVTPVAGYTTVLAPLSPVTIPFDGSQSGSGLKVSLVVTPPAVRTTPPPSTTAAPSSTAPRTSVQATTAPVVSASASAAADPVANTGPRSPVRWTLVLGVALCLLGLVLLVGGRTRRVGARRS